MVDSSDGTARAAGRPCRECGGERLALTLWADRDLLYGGTFLVTSRRRRPFLGIFGYFTALTRGVVCRQCGLTNFYAVKQWLLAGKLDEPRQIGSTACGDCGAELVDVWLDRRRYWVRAALPRSWRRTRPRASIDRGVVCLGCASATLWAREPWRLRSDQPERTCEACGGRRVLIEMPYGPRLSGTLVRVTGGSTCLDCGLVEFRARGLEALRST